MPPSVALALYILLLIGILRYAQAPEDAHTWTLWVPVIWIAILVSRLPSQWLDINTGYAADVIEEGNWLDRCVYVAVIVLAFQIVSARSVRWSGLLEGNYALTLVIVYALLSVAWSDSPGISFKRWFRDLGTYLIALVIVSDSRPAAAIGGVLRRVCYIFIPLSVVLIRYYPELGVTYDPWTGARAYQGASLSKNGLGGLCLISGIFFVWDSVTRWPQRRDRRTRRTILFDLAFIGMTLWLLRLSDSATSKLCFLIGCIVIIGIHWRFRSTRPLWLKIAIPASICLYLALESFFGLTDFITSALGRDTTMTGRTEVWHAVIPFNPNPLLGAGYEAFWLGPRLRDLWAQFWWQPTQAHNGYVEVYLNLGLIGLFIVALFLFVGYRRIWATAKTSELVSFSLAVWIVMLLANVTESGVFKGPLWLFLLVNSLVVPVSISKAPQFVYQNPDPSTAGRRHQP